MLESERKTDARVNESGHYIENHKIKIMNRKCISLLNEIFFEMYLQYGYLNLTEASLKSL